MEWSFPWLSIDGDRAYDDSDFSQFFAGLFTTGVSLTTADSLKVSASGTGGMRVQVQAGAANLEGRSYLNSAALAMPIAVASATHDRTDSVVVRMDKGTREIKLVVKAGDTSVQRASDIYELQLATINVPRNVSEITADCITDRRADATVCGYTSPFQKVAVSGLEAQYQALLQKMLDQLHQYAETEKADFETEMQAIVSQGTSYIHQAQADWQAFLATISEAMTGDVALNLQQKLMALTPDQVVFSKTDASFVYPEVEVLATTNGFGVTALGEIDWLGDVPETVPFAAAYPNKHTVVVKVPSPWKMAAPKITEIANNVFLLNEGNRTLQIRMKGSKGNENEF